MNVTVHYALTNIIFIVMIDVGIVNRYVYYGKFIRRARECERE